MGSVKNSSSVSAFKKAIKSDPKSSTAYNNYGNLLSDQAKIKEAQKQTAQRKIVIEIRKLLDTLSQFKRKKITKELEIKRGWYRKSEEDLSITLIRVKEWIKRND